MAFDAVARSYLPVLDVAEKLTIGVTPVLADQLEADGVGERMLAFLREHRLGAAEKDAAEAEGALRAAAEAEAAHYRAAVARLEELGGNALAAFQQAQGRVELIASAATHAVLPKLATREAQRLQIDAGLRSHRRRFGEPAGFWLPECGYRPGIESRLAEQGLLYTCLDQSATEEPMAALAPARTPGGPIAFTIDWPSVASCGRSRAIRLTPTTPSTTGSRSTAPGSGRSAASRWIPAPPRCERRHAGDSSTLSRRLSEYRRQRGRRGLVVFAIDTELLGHHWSEGPRWLEAVIAQAADRGIGLMTLSEARAAHEPEQRELCDSSWGEDKDLSTWDSSSVSDLAWGSRRLELRLLRKLASGALGGDAAERAARELLAVESSDWAFLDHRRQAGDYAYARAVTHAEALLEAIESLEAPSHGCAIWPPT